MVGDGVDKFTSDADDGSEAITRVLDQRSSEGPRRDAKQGHQWDSQTTIFQPGELKRSTVTGLWPFAIARVRFGDLKPPGSVKTRILHRWHRRPTLGAIFRGCTELNELVELIALVAENIQISEFFGHQSDELVELCKN